MAKRKNRHWWRTAWKTTTALWGRVLVFMAHVLVFPVDCAFCVYDVLTVNFKKTGLFGLDCRGRSGQSCPPARKYTNKWLFRLVVCPDSRSATPQRSDACPRRDSVSRYPVRGVLFLLILACLVGGGVIGGILYWPRVTPGSDGPAGRQELATEDIRAGDEAFEAGNHDLAFAHYVDALKLAPRNRRIAYRAGRCLEHQGELESAMDYYRRAIPGEQGIPDAARRLALHSYRQGRLHHAGAFARRAIELGIEDGRCEAMASEHFLMLDEAEKAKEHMDRAVALADDQNVVRAARARMLLANGELEKAASVLKEGRGTPPAQLPTWRLCQADILWKQGKPEEASTVLKSLIEEFSDAAPLRIFDVQLLLEAGQREEAISRVEELQNTFPLEPQMELHLARVLNKHGERGRALSLALEQTDRADMAREANLLAGQIYMGSGLLEPALHHAQTVLHEAPDNVDGLMLRGRVALGRNDHQTAREQFERILESRPEAPQVQYLLGINHLASENFERAIEHLKEACELQPDSGRYRFQYAKALQKAGKPKLAEEQLKQAADQMPNPYQAYTWLGLMAHNAEEHQKAAEYYRQAIQADPARSAVASNNLAELILQTGQRSPMALALAYTSHANCPPQLKDESADTLAKALINLGGAASALPAARLAASASPDDPGRLLRLGLAEGAAGNADRALDALRKAQEKGEGEEVAEVAQKLIKAIVENQKDTPERAAEDSEAPGIMDGTVPDAAE